MVWTPCHPALPRNEAARALIPRVALEADDLSASPPTRPSQADIPDRFRLQSENLCPPHWMLHKAEFILRWLHANIFHHGTRLQATYPALYSPNCEHCSPQCTLQKMLWACRPHPSLFNPTPEQWRASWLAVASLISSSCYSRRHWPHVSRASCTEDAPSRPERLNRLRFSSNKAVTPPRTRAPFTTYEMEEFGEPQGGNTLYLSRVQ